MVTHPTCSWSRSTSSSFDDYGGIWKRTLKAYTHLEKYRAFYIGPNQRTFIFFQSIYQHFIYNVDFQRTMKKIYKKQNCGILFLFNRE